MAAEAKLVHDVLRGLTEAFPELEVQVPRLQELHPDLQGDPQELVKKFKEARKQERKKDQQKSQEKAKKQTQEQAQKSPVQEPPASEALSDASLTPGTPVANGFFVGHEPSRRYRVSHITGTGGLMLEY